MYKIQYRATVFKTALEAQFDMERCFDKKANIGEDIFGFLVEIDMSEAEIAYLKLSDQIPKHFDVVPS